MQHLSFIGVPPMGKYSINEQSQVENVVIKAIDDVPNGIGIINNLSSLIDSFDNKDLLSIIKNWNKHAKKMGTVLDLHLH